MAPRCREYLTEETSAVDVEIRQEKYEPERWPGLDWDRMCYMESGEMFYLALLRHNGMMLHASAVEYEGNVYLFSGPCGVGKSTHTTQWQKTFGSAAHIINDDKPALRYVDGRWYAYGTPWSGKSGINENRKAPIAGICFLKQAEENRIRKLKPAEVVGRLMPQTLYRFWSAETMDVLLARMEALIRDVPFYELENTPGPEAVQLSYSTMCPRT